MTESSGYLVIWLDPARGLCWVHTGLERHHHVTLEVCSGREKGKKGPLVCGNFVSIGGAQ